MNRRIVLFVVAIICIGGLVAEYKYINKKNSQAENDSEPPPTEQVGSFSGSSGAFRLYMHNAPVTERINSGYVLREGNRIETPDSGWVEFDGCFGAGYSLPVQFHLRYNSRILLMKPPAVDIERGSFAAHIPAGSMGLRVILKRPEHSMAAQCRATDADILIMLENNRLIVTVFRGKANLLNTKGEITVFTNQKGSITPDEIPIEAEQITDSDKPSDVMKLFGM